MYIWSESVPSYSFPSLPLSGPWGAPTACFESARRSKTDPRSAVDTWINPWVSKRVWRTAGKCGGFHGHGGTPSSLVGLFQGKSHLEIRMMTGGTPILGNASPNLRWDPFRLGRLGNQKFSQSRISWRLTSNIWGSATSGILRLNHQEYG